MIIALIVVLMVVAYLIMGGIVGTVALAYFDNDPHSTDPEFAAFLAGLLWPIVLPICLGARIARTPERKRQRAAEAKRRERELEKEFGFPALPVTLDDLRDDLQRWKEANR